MSEAEFVAARDAAAKGNGIGEWFWYYALPAHTEEDARDALAAMPPGVDLRHFEGDIVAATLLGHLYFLVGDLDRAITYLQSAVHACFLIDLGVIFRMQAAEELGEALEAKGDVAGACAAYGEVLKRWGNAKPRSVTADRARPRARKLGCR